MSFTKSHPPPLPKQNILAKMSDLLMKFASHETMTRKELDEELNECCATYHHPFGKDAEPGDEGVPIVYQDKVHFFIRKNLKHSAILPSRPGASNPFESNSSYFLVAEWPFDPP